MADSRFSAPLRPFSGTGRGRGAIGGSGDAGGSRGCGGGGGALAGDDGGLQGGGLPLCLNWSRSFTCHFGSFCKKRHEPPSPCYIPPDPTNISLPCENARTGICRRGGCFFQHRSAENPDPSLPRHDPAENKVFIVSLGKASSGIESFLNEGLGGHLLPPRPPKFGAPNVPEEQIGLPAHVANHIRDLEYNPAEAPFVAIEDQHCKSFDKAIQVVPNAEGGYVVTYATALVAHTFPMRKADLAYQWAQKVPRSFRMMPHQTYRPLCFEILNNASLSTSPKPAVLVELTLHPSEGDRLKIVSSRVYVARVGLTAVVSFEEASAAVADLALRGQAAPVGRREKPYASIVRSAFDAARRMTLCSDPRVWKRTVRTSASLLSTLDVELSYDDPTQPGEFIIRTLQAAADKVLFDFARAALPGDLSARLLCQVSTLTEDDMADFDECLGWKDVDPAARSYQMYDEAIQRLTHGFFRASRMLKSVSVGSVVQFLAKAPTTDPCSHVTAVFSSPMRHFDSLYNQGLLLTALLGGAVCPPPDAPAKPDVVIALLNAHPKVEAALRRYLVKEARSVSARVFNNHHGRRVPCVAQAGVVMPNRKVLLADGMGEADVRDVEANEAKFPAGSIVTVVVSLCAKPEPRLLDPRVDLPEKPGAAFLA